MKTVITTTKRRPLMSVSTGKPPPKKLRIVTTQGRGVSSKMLDEIWELKEPRLPVETLLKDPKIIPKVKKLIRRSSKVEQRSKKWFEMRKMRLTGSTFASAIGWNKYQSRHKLMREKLGLEPKFEGNEATRRGTRLEPHALAAYAKKTGLRPIEMDLGLMRHENEEYECIAGSPDGVTTCGILIEIKCPMRRKIIQGSVPRHYMPQLQGLMEIMDLDLAHFVEFRPASFGQDEVCAITVVQRDRMWFKTYFPIMKSFVVEMRAKMKNPAARKTIKINLEEDAEKNSKVETKFMFL